MPRTRHFRRFTRPLFLLVPARSGMPRARRHFSFREPRGSDVLIFFGGASLSSCIAASAVSTRPLRMWRTLRTVVVATIVATLDFRHFGQFRAFREARGDLVQPRRPSDFIVTPNRVPPGIARSHLRLRPEPLCHNGDAPKKKSRRNTLAAEVLYNAILLILL